MCRLASLFLCPFILSYFDLQENESSALTFSPSSGTRSAFTSWLLMNVLLVNVPRYGAYTMIVTGLLMGLACLIFYLLMPPKNLDIRFEDVTLTFRLGWCFWLTLVVGECPVSCSQAAPSILISFIFCFVLVIFTPSTFT